MIFLSVCQLVSASAPCSGQRAFLPWAPQECPGRGQRLSHWSTRVLCLRAGVIVLRWGQALGELEEGAGTEWGGAGVGCALQDVIPVAQHCPRDAQMAKCL